MISLLGCTAGLGVSFVLVYKEASFQHLAWLVCTVKECLFKHNSLILVIILKLYLNVYLHLQEDILQHIGHTRQSESISAAKAGTSGIQSKEAPGDSNMVSVHKQQMNQSVSQSDINNQSKIVVQKDSPKSKQSIGSKEIKVRDNQTEIPLYCRTLTQKEAPLASNRKGGKYRNKRKVVFDDKEKEKKQRVAADVVYASGHEGNVASRPYIAISGHKVDNNLKAFQIFFNLSPSKQFASQFL